MESSFLLLRLVLLASALTLGACNAGCPSAGLKPNFYGSSCPNAEQIVQTIIYKEAEKNPILPAKLLRMFFHDCFVRVRCRCASMAFYLLITTLLASCMYIGL